MYSHSWLISKLADLSQILHKYTVVFPETPTHTTWIHHDADVGDTGPMTATFLSLISKIASLCVALHTCDKLIRDPL